MPDREVTFQLWLVVIGTLLVTMALATTVLRRLPLTAALLYLAAGVALGPLGVGLIRVDPITDARLLERITEAVVVVALFSVGLKLRTPLSDRRWRLPVRLATVSMMLTMGMVALVGVYLLGLPPGAAVLLGAILAPTDPVLASDVQVEDPRDRDRLRFGLTGEAGLNDGAAFPFVMLGLGLLGHGELGVLGSRWLAADVLWATAAGLAIGALLGTGVGKLILYLRVRHRETMGTDDFLALGLIALSYGAALLAHAYGFLAVFAAGLALRRVERLATGTADPAAEVQDVAAEEAVGGEGAEGEPGAPPTAEDTPGYMARAVLGFSEQLERIGTLGVVLLVGGMLATTPLSPDALWFVPLLFLVIRPLSVALGAAGTSTHRVQRSLIAWFGVRGIGSIYYLAFAIERGLPAGVAERLTPLALATVATSIVVHGISVTPLMVWYSRWSERRRR